MKRPATPEEYCLQYDIGMESYFIRAWNYYYGGPTRQQMKIVRKGVEEYNRAGKYPKYALDFLKED